MKRPTPSARTAVKRRRAGSRFVWPEELVRLFGRMSDRRLARMAKVSVETVTSERRRLGIAPYRPRRQSTEWTSDMIARLGCDSDYNVARALALPRNSVRRKRRALGIPAYLPPPHDRFSGFAWTAEDLALLGKLPDQKVADLLGISATVVNRKRLELKIPATSPAAPAIRWTDEMLACLGHIADVEVAKRFGISIAAVKRKRERLGVPAFFDRGIVIPSPVLIHLLHHLPNVEVRRRTGLCNRTLRKLRDQLGIESPYPKRWSPELLARLGKEPDPWLAKEIGLSPSRVRYVRLSLGIAAFIETRRWRVDEIALLGTAPDRVVAWRLGRTERAVQNKRKKLRIPPRS